MELLEVRGRQKALSSARPAGRLGLAVARPVGVPRLQLSRLVISLFSSTMSDQQMNAEMQQILQQEQQMMMVQAAISKLTDICWDKCMAQGRADRSIGRKETSCIANTAAAYLGAR